MSSCSQLRLSLNGEPIWSKEPGAEGEESSGVALEPQLVALQQVDEAGIIARLWDSLMLFFYKLFGMSTS